MPKLPKEIPVRVVAKTTKRNQHTYVTYNIAFPKKYAEELKIEGGDILHARIVEVEVEPGKRVRGVFFYKP